MENKIERGRKEGERSKSREGERRRAGGVRERRRGTRREERWREGGRERKRRRGRRRRRAEGEEEAGRGRDPDPEMKGMNILLQEHRVANLTGIMHPHLHAIPNCHEISRPPGIKRRSQSFTERTDHKYQYHQASQVI